jgi:hypothetical protein
MKEKTPMSYTVPGETAALLNELSQPITPALRSRFVERVLKLLAGDESPGRVVATAAKVQAEMLNAPAIGDPPVVRPTRKQEPRGPWRRRA